MFWWHGPIELKKVRFYNDGILELKNGKYIIIELSIKNRHNTDAIVFDGWDISIYPIKPKNLIIKLVHVREAVNDLMSGLVVDGNSGTYDLIPLPLSEFVRPSDKDITLKRGEKYTKNFSLKIDNLTLPAEFYVTIKDKSLKRPGKVKVTIKQKNGQMVLS